MERENIKYRLNSGKEKFLAEGGKVGRKEGYKKPDEKLQEEYAGVIKQLKKGYPFRMIAKNEGVGISTVQRIKRKFVDTAEKGEDYGTYKMYSGLSDGIRRRD